MFGDKMVVVDLNSGRYTEELKGYELFNLKQTTSDGKYYGYVPPDNKLDIRRIDKKAKEFVSGVLVVYVQAISKKDKNRQIIAYCENAVIYNKSKSGNGKNRTFKDNDGNIRTADYIIESDNLTDLRDLPEKYTIVISNYNSFMFRKQKSYLDEYPDLKADIIKYILVHKNIEPDSNTEQSKIQAAAPASDKAAKEYSQKSDEYIQTSNSLQVKKNPSISKKVLFDCSYQCFCDPRHQTFYTKAGIPYMEGHHLIPCTVENSRQFALQSKLDREENIVCLCPTCHRAIHYGNNNTKKAIIEHLFNKQKTKLKHANLVISLEELKKLYIL